MNIRVVYCNHESTSLAVRERLAFSGEERLRSAYQQLRLRFPESESVVVSTCNRIELYFASDQRGSLPETESVARFLSEFHQIPLDDFYGDLRQETEREAVKHLFLVASSLDSMVLGEAQIVNQIKEAYQKAAEQDTVGPISHQLFQSAMSVAGKVRTDTKLSEGRISIASVAVGEFGKGIFERFDNKVVLILGAGEMAEETLRYLVDEGVREILIANRSFDRGSQLAEKWGGKPILFDFWKDYLSSVDVIVSTTGANEPIVTASQFSELRKNPKAQRPLFILDLGAPRDFDPAIARIDDNIFLYDIDDLEQTCTKNRTARIREVDKATLLVEQATQQFMHQFYHRSTTPVVQQLRDNWHNVSQQELERLFKKLEHLSDSDRQQIEFTLNRVVNKLLHPPLETIKHHSREGTPHTLLETVKQLFGLRD